MRANRFAALVVVLLLISVAPAAAQDVRYRVVDLGQVDGTASVALGINDNGEVCGWNITTSHEQRAVKAGPNSPFQYVPGLENLFAIASAINANGDLAVDVQVSPWPYVVTRAMRYSSGTLEDLDSYVSGSTYSFSINSTRQVAGYTGWASAYVATPGSRLSYLGTFGGPQSFAYGVNDAGQVVGTAQVPGGAGHAFRYMPGIGKVDLNPANAAASDAQAINASGQVAGTMVVNGQSHAFRYADGVGVQDLGTGGGLHTLAYAINDKGQVVGDIRTAVWPHAFFYSDETGLVDLNARIDADSGWLLTHAYGINSRGEIVGEGLLGAQFTSRAFKLVPYVLDREPPVIASVSATPSVLWPPSGQMVPVEISVDVTDNADPSPACTISSVLSDGDSAADDAIVRGLLSLDLRAKRSGTTTDRVYTIGVACSDASGNRADASVTVAVPHDDRAGGLQ
jgi:probable HAF family extracellular repeat protein